MQQIITEFFEEQFQDTSQFFLYKDKQLLKNEKYLEYAHEQIRKANKIFWSIAFGVFMCSWYGITSLIEYGADPNWFDLSLGLGSFIGIFLALFYSAKEYYTIKSSMSLLVKLIESTESGETQNAQT